MDAFASLKRFLAETDLPYVVIGAYAVNVFLEPRYTADVDLLVQATESDVETLKDVLMDNAFSVQTEQATDEASVPDVIRFKSDIDALVLDIQIAKTDYQREVIDRATEVGGLRVATAEDLIIMKLIADRAKDRIDLEGLIALPDLDWQYVHRWAVMWDVEGRLTAVRKRDD